MATLKELRVTAGLTQGQLAALVGVLPTRISDWEHGRRSPTMRYLRELAQALDVTSDEVLQAIDESSGASRATQ